MIQLSPSERNKIRMTLKSALVASVHRTYGCLCAGSESSCWLNSWYEYDLIWVCLSKLLVTTCKNTQEKYFLYANMEIKCENSYKKFESVCVCVWAWTHTALTQRSCTQRICISCFTRCRLSFLPGEVKKFIFETSCCVWNNSMLATLRKQIKAYYILTRWKRHPAFRMKSEIRIFHLK